VRYGKWRSTQTSEARESVQVADDGNDPVRAQARNVVATPHEPVESHLAAEQVGGAQRDVTTADQQNPDHARITPSLPATRTDARVAANRARRAPFQANQPCRSRLP
jgi:hypothetical protein